EKDAVMKRFYEGVTKVLVSTVVIEVGIHVQNASVMIIENAERFGLAQMHQLRGRVGRGENKSYCLIIIGAKSDIAVARADALCSTSDGFIIAENDLAMRGPGEVFGVRQHGLPELKIADLSKHMKVFMEAREDAAEFLMQDFALAREENFVFSQHIKEKFDAETSFVL
ncbi:MAG: DNA helicase RecG, partial [Candidatus Moranbacteria bacterium]|nr:DNA helicase RecG [Candidatus Moranbacteria bacterium]